MNIETDHYDVNVQIGVGYRTCKNCGKTFAKDMQYPKRTLCPECRESSRKGHKEIQKTAASFREMKRCEEIEAQNRLERMRKRDAAWSRWERENGVSTRFDDRPDMLVETRGRIG